MSDKLSCAICTAFIGGRKHATTSIKVVCTTCKENFSIHLTCLKSLLAIHQQESRYSNVVTDSSELTYFQCSSCRENCYMCGASHCLQDSNVELLTCSKSSLHQCYVIGPSKNKNTGCLSKLSPSRKKLFEVQPYVCAICIKEGTGAEENDKEVDIGKNDLNSTYDLKKVFSDKISDSEENKMLKIVRMCLVLAYVPREEMDAEQLEYNTMATIDNCNTECKKTSVT